MGDLPALKQEWNGFKKKMKTTIEQVAQAKIEAGFRYDYLRVAENTSLLEIDLTDADVAHIHAPLLCGDIQAVLEWLRRENHTPETYLLQEKVTRDQSWGFSLKIGKWTLLEGKDRKKLITIDQQNFEDSRRLALLGARIRPVNAVAGLHEGRPVAGSAMFLSGGVNWWRGSVPAVELRRSRWRTGASTREAATHRCALAGASARAAARRRGTPRG